MTIKEALRQPAEIYLLGTLGIAAILYLIGVNELWSYMAGSIFGTGTAIRRLHQMILDTRP